jgi:hypothetical protein
MDLDRWVLEDLDKWVHLIWCRVGVLLVDLTWDKVDRDKWVRVADQVLKWVAEVLKVRKWCLEDLDIWVDLRVI